MKKISVFQLITVLLIGFLSVEVVLLTLQNRELKHRLDNGDDKADVLNTGDNAEGFFCETMDGEKSQITISDSSEKTLLFVFSTTCPYCFKTLKDWKILSEQLKNVPDKIIGVSLHEREKTKEYIQKNDVPFHTICSIDTSFTRKYKITGVPQTILINNKTGQIERIWIGALTDVQREEIRKMACN